MRTVAFVAFCNEDNDLRTIVLEYGEGEKVNPLEDAYRISNDLLPGEEIDEDDFQNWEDRICQGPEIDTIKIEGNYTVNG